MKIETEAFRNAFALASVAAAGRAPMDILGRRRGWELSFCVRASRLKAALEIAGESIELAVKANALTWKSGRARYTMATLPHEDFPAPTISTTTNSSKEG